ncbi:reticulophagy regulator 3-like isoform X2 [Dermacentor silvarum]|uniref:reticulophagy regulator 3-like isoform X2 n=1 Tax=Dermacentor silvarum TaxID=543639 RepID=UPI002101A516|nr:reticulophagy regulator 3-like isoform X2 [Dermacentor silvarum]
MAAAQKRVLQLLAWSRGFLRSGFERQLNAAGTGDRVQDCVLERVLGPFEAHLISIQSLLIWERPYVSATAFVAVNCLFWLVVSCSRRFYSFVALIAAVVFMYKTWVNSIWPEIRVPPPEGEDNEQWTPVHPQVFSVPELSRYITDWSESVRKWFANVILLRKTNPGLFCILASSTFAMTAVLGRMVSGVLILYSLLMAVTLGPGIALYVIPATWYEQADALMRIASGKPPRRKQRNDDGGGVGEGSGPTNTEEEQDELEEFLPKMDERLLAKQLSLSLESDTRSSTLSDTSLLPQGLATAPPLDSLDEETQFYEGMGSLPDYDEDTDLDSFLPDMTTMPSLSEVCDSDEQLLPSAATASSASMHFSTSHFKMDSSDSEGDDALIRGLTSARRPARQPEASKSRPLAVGPRTSRHSSQGSDIDIDEYEVVDTRELPHL